VPRARTLGSRNPQQKSLYRTQGDSNLYEVKQKGSVTGGTAKDLIRGKTKGTVCVFTITNGVLRKNFPGSTVTF